jgi:uncharacterized protein with NAD-binding domain and iron-sulfur cluster
MVYLIQILARQQKNCSHIIIPNPTYNRFDSNSCKTPKASHKVTYTHRKPSPNTQHSGQNNTVLSKIYTSREFVAKCSAIIAPGYTAAKMVQFRERFVQNGTQNCASKKLLQFVVIFGNITHHP